MNRRIVLKSLFAAPLVYGLGEIFSRRPFLIGDEPPAWLKDALRRMKDTGRAGVVLVAPAGEEVVKDFGRAFLAQVESPDARIREIFAEAVFICLTPELAAKFVPGEGNRRLLDPEGKVVAADSVEASTVDKSFASSFAVFLHGKDLDRLRAVVAWRRAALADDERVDLDRAMDVAARGEDGAEAALEVLEAAADRILPWLALTAIETKSSRARESLLVLVRAAGQREIGRVPFGARLPLFREICGFHEEIEKEEDAAGPSIACGMALPNENARRFLRLLTL